MIQTDIQNLSAIKQGSVKVLIGNDFDNLVDIGAVRDPVITSLVENQSIEFDNTDPLKKFVKGKRIQVTFTLCEINFANIAVLDDGIMNLTTVAGALVSGETQAVASGAWNYETFIPIENQNGDGSAVAVSGISGATDGSLTEDTDFNVVEANGKYGIVFHAGGNITTLSQIMTITYSYTPNASKKLTVNDSGTKVLKAMRLINTDANGKVFQLDINEGTNFAPFALDFATDVEDNVATAPIDFQGKFVQWIDEQTV